MQFSCQEHKTCGGGGGGGGGGVGGGGKQQNCGGGGDGGILGRCILSLSSTEDILTIHLSALFCREEEHNAKMRRFVAFLAVVSC